MLQSTYGKVPVRETCQRLWLHEDDLDDDDGDDGDDNDDNDVEVWHKHHKRVLADLPPLSAWLTLA